MGTSSEAIQAYITAAATPEPGPLEALAQHLASDVVVAGIVGAARGKDAVLDALAAPNATRLVSAATWSEPQVEGDETVVDAGLPAGVPMAALRFGFRFDSESRILHIGQQMVQGPPPARQALAITDEMATAINGALANGTPFVVSYVDAGGAPRISPRGSVQALGEKQLGLWARDPEGGILKGIAANPNLSLYYRDPKTRTTFTMAGRAYRVTDDATRTRIYENQPEIERNFDGRKRGVAIVVDLESIDGAGPAGRVRMAADVSPG
jgi:hypothetical protein